MDLSKGYQIEEPHVFVPWDTLETQFMDGFEGLHLRLVKHGYFTTHCTSLQGLSHELGFHFSPWENGRLVELEFYSRSNSNLDESYQGFQHHLEGARLRRLSLAHLDASRRGDPSLCPRAFRTSGIRPNPKDCRTHTVVGEKSPLHQLLRQGGVPVSLVVLKSPLPSLPT
jgi:hypothetical protein